MFLGIDEKYETLSIYPSWNCSPTIMIFFSDASICCCFGPQHDPVLPQPVRLPGHPLCPLHCPHGSLLCSLRTVLPQGVLHQEGPKENWHRKNKIICKAVFDLSSSNFFVSYHFVMTNLWLLFSIKSWTALEVDLIPQRGVNFINCFTPCAELSRLAPNFCASKKLLQCWALISLWNRPLDWC